MSKESSLESETFFQLLFELSHESRYMILQFLREKPLRVTDIAKRLELTSQEISRHVSRLSQINVIFRDYKGFYNLSPLGHLCLKNLEGLSFTSSNIEYFSTHTSKSLPEELLSRFSELNNSLFLGNIVNFVSNMSRVINDADEYILLISNHFPIHVLSELTTKLKEGIKLRILEPINGFHGPTVTLDSQKSVELLKENPSVERKVRDTKHIFLLASEKNALFALPTVDNKTNYRGYYITEDPALGWIHDLFTILSYQDVFKHTRAESQHRDIVSFDQNSIVVYGYNDPDRDHSTLQNAVDKYERVTLKGGFNLGEKGITVTKNVKIMGEGRENGKPSTYVYMSGWKFPFTEHDSLFLVDADNCDVSIENIYFNDYKYICIYAVRGNKLTIKNNWIELDYPIGRGRTNPLYGDGVLGIAVNGPGLEYNPGFPGGVIIEGNYLDHVGTFAGGYFENTSLLEASERENLLQSHKYCNGYGIYIRWTRGEVLIKNNIVKNMSSRSITVSENYETARISIHGNCIETTVPGSHIHDPRWAGIGIEAEPAFHYPGKGFQLSISNNHIILGKPRFCGIMIRGLMNAPPYSYPLKDGQIINNNIMLEDGSVGILLESCENYEIIRNKISGKSYFGIGLFPGTNEIHTEYGAIKNVIKDNDLSELVIKSPDEYSKELFTTNFYKPSDEYTSTSKIFLNNNSKENIVNQPNDTKIDDGIENCVN